MKLPLSFLILLFVFLVTSAEAQKKKATPAADQDQNLTQPVKESKNFQKIFLKKGETRTVTFNITSDDLKFYKNQLQHVYEPGDFKVFVGTNSRDAQEASFTLTK